jgi:DNA (cytosine-5)-methyltransferase 1
MGNRAYYNEIDPYAAAWLRNLIKAGHIPDGDVDERSIADVQPMDIADYTQCHFFAGIGGWSLALRLAGWPDDRPVWTGSCPCQPFSVAGKRAGTDDPRHLWPHFFRLIRARKPEVVMGEQVAGKAGYGWLDGVRFDLEAEGYACDGVDIPACAVDAPHIRQRLYWVAHADGELHDGRGNIGPGGGDEYPNGSRRRDMGDASGSGLSGDNGRWPRTQFTHRHAFGDAEWRRGADGKTRRVKSGVRLLAHGVPARVGKLRAYGNAIVPPLAAEVIKAFMDA